MEGHDDESDEYRHTLVTVRRIMMPKIFSYLLELLHTYMQTLS